MEMIFRENLFNVYFDFLVWPMFHLQAWEPGIYDLLCSQTPWDEADVLASLF